MRHALHKCQAQVDYLFVPPDAMHDTESAVPLCSNEIGDIQGFTHGKCAVIGASTPSAKSLVRSLKAKDGISEFLAVEFVRSDSGFCGHLGNALLSPIGVLNSQLAAEALCDVVVFSTNGIKVAGRVNVYVVVMRFCRHGFAAEHPVQLRVDTLLDSVSCSLDLDDSAGASHCIAVADIRDIHHAVSEGALRFARIHQMRKLNGTTRCIYSMDRKHVDSQDLSRAIRRCSAHYAVLGQSITAGISMYVPKSSRCNFDAFWQQHSMQFSGFCISESPSTFVFYVYDSRHLDEIDRVAHLLKQFVTEQGIDDSSIRFVKRMSEDRWNIKLHRIGRQHSDVTVMSPADPLISDSVVNHLFSQLNIPVGNIQCRNDSDGNKVYVQMSNASSQKIASRIAFTYSGVRHELSFTQVSHAPMPLSRKLPSSGPDAEDKTMVNRDDVGADPDTESSNEIVNPTLSEAPLSEINRLQVGEFASLKLHNSESCVHCRVDECLDEANRVYKVLLSQSEASQVLCAEGMVRRVSDSRGDAYVVHHPAFPAELGLQSGQKWFSLHTHGGEDATKMLAETSLQRWTTQFRDRAIASLTMTVALNNSAECSVNGAQTGDVHTCSEWQVIRSDSFEGRLLHETGVWAPAHSSETQSLARIVRSLS